MTSDQIRLARSRLWLGITNVGFWVLSASGGLYWLACRSGDSLDARFGVLIALAAINVQAVFDFIGGAWLRPRPRPAIRDFLGRWLRGAFAHTAVLVGVGLLSYASFLFTSGFAAGVLLATVALALGRRKLLETLGGASLARIDGDGGKAIAAEVDDPAFTGGIVGFGRRAVSVLPASWLRNLPNAELAVESRRRQWQMENGLHARALALVLGWNLAGTATGSIAFDLAARAPAEALLGHACWMTLWAFASLLVLPAWSRKAVFAADRAAADSGLDPRAWITRFPDLTGEDGSSIAAVQTIFYPVPSAEMRLHQLQQRSSGFVPGNLARTNLYYSWATLTLLGRAVHCNVGRPALWVFPPSA